MEIQIQPAFITAITTLTVFICKDIVVAAWFGKREQARKETEQLRLYIEPLVMSAKKLFWRLNEVFSPEGRGLYLRKEAPLREYNQYKKASCLYRLASLLGWKRAFRKELTLVKLDLVTDFDKVESALNEIEKALADGTSVELQRLINVEKIWTHITVPVGRRAEIAVKLEQALDSLNSLGVLSSQSTIAVDSPLLESVPNLLSDIFERELNSKTDELVVTETRARIVNALCIRESWIYREWQEALGDLMIVNVTNSNRRCDVIGYQKFLDLCQAGSPGERSILHKIERLFEDIDLTNDRDSRVQLLWSTYKSSARFIRDVAAAFPGTTLLAKTELATIEKIADLDGEFKFTKQASS